MRVRQIDWSRNLAGNHPSKKNQKIKMRTNSQQPGRKQNHQDVDGKSQFAANSIQLKAVIVPESFRRLKWNEVVARGDFVEDENLGIKPWEGPAGFRADAFLKPIYRNRKTRRSASAISA